MTADEVGLTGLWLVGSKYYCDNLKVATEAQTPAISKTLQWLDVYFQGHVPDFTPQLSLSGTKFQMDVWEILRAIPYGKTITYGSIAKQLAEKNGMARVSAQAVGQAVGRNPVAIIVPCHRVVGANGTLTGYAGGLDKKFFLLNLEGVDIANLPRCKS